MIVWRPRHARVNIPLLRLQWGGDRQGWLVPVSIKNGLIRRTPHRPCQHQRDEHYTDRVNNNEMNTTPTVSTTTRWTLHWLCQQQQDEHYTDRVNNNEMNTILTVSTINNNEMNTTLTVSTTTRWTLHWLSTTTRWTLHRPCQQRDEHYTDRVNNNEMNTHWPCQQQRHEHYTDRVNNNMNTTPTVSTTTRWTLHRPCQQQRDEHYTDRVEVDLNNTVIAAVGIGRQQRLLKLISRTCYL